MGKGNRLSNEEIARRMRDHSFREWEGDGKIYHYMYTAQATFVACQIRDELRELVLLQEEDARRWRNVAEERQREIDSLRQELSEVRAAGVRQSAIAAALNDDWFTGKGDDG